MAGGGGMRISIPKKEYLWWSKDSDPSKLPELQLATKEQLAKFDIEWDGRGHIVSIKVKSS